MGQTNNTGMSWRWERGPRQKQFTVLTEMVKLRLNLVDTFSAVSTHQILFQRMYSGGVFVPCIYSQSHAR